METPEKYRMLLSITSDTTSEIDRLAKKECITRTELIRRALALYFVVDREISVNEKKRKLVIAEGSRIVERLIFR